MSSNYWKKGYATEGAIACLEYAKKNLQLTTIYSIAPQINVPSLAVMKKIGMPYVKSFDHPKLKGDPNLEKCDLYEINLIKNQK